MGIINTLTEIYGLKADALANMWEMEINPPVGLKKVKGIKKEQVTGRVQSVSIPAVQQTPYEVHFKTGVVTKAGGKHGSPKEFSFDVRADREYDLYAVFYAWANYPNNTGNTMYYNDPSAYSGSITIHRVDKDLNIVNGKDDKNKGWKFSNVWVSSVGELAMDYTNGEPVIVTVTVQFSTMEVIDLGIKKQKSDNGDTENAKNTQGGGS